MHHLRVGDQPEWEEFAKMPVEKELFIHFKEKQNKIALLEHDCPPDFIREPSRCQERPNIFRFLLSSQGWLTAVIADHIKTF